MLTGPLRWGAVHIKASARHLATLLTLMLCVTGPPALAWWDAGHTLVCQEAINRVTPETRARLRALGGIPMDCGWPDRIKRAQPHTRPWHYLNAPPGTLDLAHIERPPTGDVLSALATKADELKTLRSPESRRQALWWVGHLVGDLHQPMHLGYADDLGGNTYRLTLPAELANRLGEDRRHISMHAVWDGLIQRYGGIVDISGEFVDAPPLKPNSLREQMLNWANDTLLLVNNPEVAYRYKTRIKTLTPTYLDAQSHRVRAQLGKAAQRLAQLLDWAFAEG